MDINSKAAHKKGRVLKLESVLFSNSLDQNVINIFSSSKFSNQEPKQPSE